MFFLHQPLIGFPFLTHVHPVLFAVFNLQTKMLLSAFLFG
ncbi:Uncharacterised protein [Vibrio cholerae]|nr:Uncharacterised protein [Vibrio cholerae]